MNAHYTLGIGLFCTLTENMLLLNASLCLFTLIIVVNLQLTCHISISVCVIVCHAPTVRDVCTLVPGKRYAMCRSFIHEHL